MPYNPLYVVTFIRDLFRRMYLEYGGIDYAWNEDPRLSKITIGTVSNVNSGERIQQFPRILIQRGPSLCSTQFIANNLEKRYNGGIAEGGHDTHRTDITGSINIIIECCGTVTYPPSSRSIRS